MKASSSILKRKSFSLIEIIIVVAIIGILATLAVPNVLRAVHQAKARQCQANLYAIDTACQMYFVEHRAPPPTGDLANAGLNNYFPDTDGDGTGDLPVCPFGNTYTLIADTVTGGAKAKRSDHNH